MYAFTNSPTAALSRAPPDNVCGEASVERKGSLIPECLHGAVHGALVGHAAVRVRGHLLQTSLDEVKGQGAGAREETCESRKGAGE